MCRNAKSLFPLEPHAFELGHINSLVLDTLIDLGSRKFAPAWITLGLAIRATSLHESNRKDGVANKIKATVLGCFVLETFLAIKLSKIPSFRRDQAMQLGFLDEEGMDEWQPWAGCDGFGTSPFSTAASGAKRTHSPMLAKSTFNQLVKLCYGINDHAVGQICKKSHNEEQYLYKWIQDFPESLGPLHSLRGNESTPQRLNLFLAYLFTRAICSPQSHSNAVDEALGVFDHYSSTLGHSTMPPLFHVLLDVFQQSPTLDGLRRTRLAGIRSRLSKVWEPRTSIESILSPLDMPNQYGVPQQSPGLPEAPTQHRRSTTQEFREGFEIPPIPLPSLLQDRQMKPNFPGPTRPAESFAHETSPQQRLLDFPPQAPNTSQQPMYNSPYDTFNSRQYHPIAPSISNGPLTGPLSGFTDLDALFDDLTSFDGVDAGLQPQFMQNLGFAPNADLADFMGFDVP